MPLRFEHVVSTRYLSSMCGNSRLEVIEVGRGKVQGAFGNIKRSAKASNWDLGRCGGQGLGRRFFAQEVSHQGGFADGRRNGIEANALARVFPSKRARNHLDRSFGGRIPHQSIGRLAGDARCDIDHASRALSHQMWKDDVD